MEDWRTQTYCGALVWQSHPESSLNAKPRHLHLFLLFAYLYLTFPKDMFVCVCLHLSSILFHAGLCLYLGDAGSLMSTTNFRTQVVQGQGQGFPLYDAMVTCSQSSTVWFKLKSELVQKRKVERRWKWLEFKLPERLANVCGSAGLSCAQGRTRLSSIQSHPSATTELTGTHTRTCTHTCM